MVAQRKYPEELRERATRLAVEARRDPATARGAIRRVATQLGVHPEALRTWVRQAEIDGGSGRSGTIRRPPKVMDKHPPPLRCAKTAVPQ